VETAEPEGMITIEVTPAEVAQGALTPEHLAAAVRAINDDGIVVLKDVVDLEHIRILREKMTADVEAILARKDVPFNWNSGNLQQAPPPIVPYLFRDVLVNELAVQVASGVLGPKIKNNFYSGNTALPSEERQPVHADTGHLWPNASVASPAYALVVNVPMVDVSAENGGTEIWPGSHKDTSVSWFNTIEVSEEVLAERRKTSPPIQATATAGSLIIRDMRLWHAGMPNKTQVPRPMIALIYWADWMNTWGGLQFPKGTEDLFQHPVLHTQAEFVDGPINYILHGGAHAYTHETEEGNGK
jgi:ectoine hydroxylase-related dioxygenase (phytanoyl-CoA dioxygenase family)